MVKLPRWPQEWNDQSADTLREIPRPGPDLNTGPDRILDGWQSPSWNLESSGLSLVLHPQTIAQIDFSDGQGVHAAQPMAAQAPADQQAAQPPHWSAADNSVHLSNDMSGVAESVGREFNQKTGRNLVVTGGARTPARQAEVMYDKFRDGDRSTYPGPSGREIQEIYDRGTADGQTREQILQNMATTIQSQKDAGHPVSRHLDDQALDFRSYKLNDREKAVLQDAIRNNAGIPLVEGIPQHIHGSFPVQGRR
jgi:hypothetical protein